MPTSRVTKVQITEYMLTLTEEQVACFVALLDHIPSDDMEAVGLIDLYNELEDLAGGSDPALRSEISTLKITAEQPSVNGFTGEPVDYPPTIGISRREK